MTENPNKKKRPEKFPWHKVGIIADSHGQDRSIAHAIHFLKRYQVDCIFHLGDICDSFLPKTVDACIDHIVQHGVRAIKGNNDHMLVANNKGISETKISPSLLQYLESLPLIEEYQNVIFAHSLPYPQEMGLACMVQKMGKAAAGMFFRSRPETILFRGHSHTPELAWMDGCNIMMEHLLPGISVDLDGKTSCVITCGALVDGFCMIWEPDRHTLALLSFPTD